MGKIFRLYEEHAAEWDGEFRRLRERFADRMQCRRGCSGCCSQMFSISPLEAAVIAEAVGAMPPRDRERLRRAAREYMDAAARLGLTGGPDAEAAVTPRTGARLPCPALKDDACSLYEVRPLICRKWGVPVYDPSKPDRLHACELNFSAGESIEPGDLVARQRTLLDGWQQLTEAASEQVPETRRSFTVAEAILADARLE